MSQTAVVQRTPIDMPRRSSRTSLLQPSPSTSKLHQATPSSSVTTTTTNNTHTTKSVTLPKLNLTPLKDSLLLRTSSPSAVSPAESSRGSPGTPKLWEHPRMDEVFRRQSRSKFDGSNVRAVAINLAGLVLSVVAPSLLYSRVLPRTLAHALHPYDTYVFLGLRLLLLSNTLLALTPLLRTNDSCEDIPLTTPQRALLGLPPLSRPATPQEQESYVTPPRHARSSSASSSYSSGTPPHSHSSPSSLRVLPSGSPLEYSLRRSVSGSPYGSPAQQQQQQQQRTASPLSGLRDRGPRRSSYGTPRSSPLGVGEESGLGLGAGSTGTPSKGGSRASVGLNSKWLYEKGRASPSAAIGRGFGNGWGTGSVFN